MCVFVVKLVGLVTCCAGVKPRDFRAFDDGRIVFIGDDGSVGAGFVGVAYQAKQRFFLLFAVEHKIGVENFVPTMLAVGLGEHHQFYVCWIAVQRAVVFQQIVHFIGRKCQAHLGVCGEQRVFAAAQNIHAGEGWAVVLRE